MSAILEQVVYIFIYVWYGYDTSRAEAMTTFDEYNNNIEEYPTLSAFLKVELRSPLFFRCPHWSIAAGAMQLLRVLSMW